MTDNYDIKILTGEGCPHCGTAKEMLKDKISSGRVKVLDVTKDIEGQELAAKYNIDGVPTLIIKDKTTNITEACQLSADGKKALCKNKEVEI